jgi:hypothetical protein
VVKESVKFSDIIATFEHVLSTETFSNKVRKVVVMVDTEGDYVECIGHLQTRWIDNYRFQVIPSLEGVKIHEPKLECPIPFSDCTGRYACIVGNPTIHPFVINGIMQSFPNLPAAVEEAKFVSDLLSCEPLVLQDATKEAVLNRLARARLVHISTHCGERGLVFSDNKILTSQEIKQLKFTNGPPMLVLLNCCKTAEVVDGPNGIKGIAVAFLMAHVIAVICIRGEVYDKDALHFSKCFYHCAIEEGMPATLSFHQALLSIRDSCDRYIYYGRDVQLTSN